MTEPTAIRLLERVLLSTWPALEDTEDDGWVYRASAGVTGRANSLAVLEAGAPDPRKLDRVEQWYRERQLRPLVRVTPLTGQWVLDEVEGRGYEAFPAPSEVMTRALPDVVDTTDGRGGAAVTLFDRADDAWWALTGRSDHDRAVLERAFEQAGQPVAYASVKVAGEVIAIGQAALGLGHVTVFSMNTAAAHRGRGHAQRVLDALEAWGHRLGAHTAALQVVRDNSDAQRLYRRRGYAVRYPYEYVRAPS